MAVGKSGRLKRLANWLKPTLTPLPHTAERLAWREGRAAEAMGQLNEGCYAQARDIFQTILSTQPEDEQAFRGLLSATLALGDHAAAITLLTQAIAQWPNQAEWYYNRGVAHSERKHYEAALADYETALTLRPHDAATLNNRGICLSKLQRHRQACESYDRAIAINPHYAQALNNRGHALSELKRYEDALVSFTRAIQLQPNYAEALHGAGITLGKLKRHEEALKYFYHALAAKPDYTEAWNGRGITLGELKRHAEALPAYANALAREPNYVEAINNRSNSLAALGRIAEARAGYDRAIALNPDYANAYRNRGILNLDALELEEALVDFDKAIACDGEESQSLLDKSLILLLRGDFEEGWKCYEGRRHQEICRSFPQPLWLGDFPLAGKTILLHCEQGIGDTIQFCRYIPLVKKLGARIILEVQRPLVKMLHQLDGVSVLVPKGEPVPVFDFHCPLMSLPLALKTTLETIPSPGGYLTAKPHKSEAWMGRLDYPKSPRIGLVWSGNPEHNRDLDRSIPLPQMMAALPSDRNYICLQKDLSDADRVALPNHSNLRLTGQWMHDFTDTAALIAAMDLVITVDTSVAHLAGALGKPVWLLISYRPDFRWMLERTDTPWYDSVKLYRQTVRGEWDDVLDRVRTDLSVRFTALQ